MGLASLKKQKGDKNTIRQITTQSKTERESIDLGDTIDDETGDCTESDDIDLLRNSNKTAKTNREVSIRIKDKKKKDKEEKKERIVKRGRGHQRSVNGWKEHKSK